MRIAAVAQGQQQQFEFQRPQALRSGRGAGQHRRRLIRQAGEQCGDLGLVRRLPKIKERRAFQFAKKQGAGARSRNAQGVAPGGIDFENERIGQNAPDRAGIDFATLGRAPLAAQEIPVRIKFPTCS